MSQTPTLDVFLMELTKDSIYEVAQWLGVSIPKSWKKERMASALAEQHESNPSTLLPLLGLATIMFLRSLGENAPDGRFAWRKQRDNVKLLPDITADLRHFGLILPDDEHHEFIVAPIALQLAHSASEQDLRHAEHLQLVELCAIGVLNTYGVLEKKEFIRILNRCYSDLSADFLSIFVEARTGLLQRADRYSEENGNLWWCSEWMEEPDAWIDEIQTRSDIAYKLYSEDVYLHAVLHGYPKKPRNFDRLTKLLEAHGIDHDEAEDMLHDEILDHNNELQPRAAVPAFMKVIVWESMDEAQRVMSLIMEFSNDTPLWINKGHAPAELSRKLPPYIGKPTFMGAFADEMNAAWDRRIQDAPRRESPGAVVPFPPPNPQVRPFPTPSAPAKVGRNDPCPCGSGKKYKHCCGNNT